jgi:TetR/AcrR family transcriptional regulator, transcriptional repressor for nem operon
MSDTREYIIDQSYKLFLSHSYEAVSISEISKAIGFTKGALYHHFLNKEELFKAVIDKYLIITELSVLTKEITLYELIEESIKSSQEMLRNIFGEVPAFVPVNYLSLFIDAIRHYPSFAKDKELLFRSEIEKVKIVMDNAAKRGEIRSDIDNSAMATNFFSINFGIVGNLIHNSSPTAAIETLRKQLHELYNVLKI